MNKFLTVFFMAMFIISSVNISYAENNPFSDVEEGKYYTDSVLFLNEKGIMTGYNETAFGVGEKLKREEMITLIWKAEERPSNNIIYCFDDVPENKYYTLAIGWARGNQIITGKSERVFGRGEAISRQDFVKVLYEYANFKKYNTEVDNAEKYLEKEDSGQVSNYAKESVNWAYEYEFIGVGSNLNPKKSISREEAATVLARFFKYYKFGKEDENVEIPYVSFYEKIQKGQEVNVLIVGDSIGRGEGVSSTEKMWFNLLKKFIEEDFGSKVNLVNISMSGNITFAEYSRVMMLETDKAFDLAVLCVGHNDTSYSYFYQTYEALVRAIHKKWPGCTMISMLQSSQLTYTDKVMGTMEIAEHYGIPVADTIAPFTNGSFGSYESLTSDYIHPNDKGQEVYYYSVAGLINDMVYRGISGRINDVEPLYKYTHLFDEYLWIPASEFIRQGNSFTYNTNGKSLTGAFSLYYTFFRGNNSCNVYFDGEQIRNIPITLEYADRQEQILHWTEDFYTINSSITVEFADKTQADGFFGAEFTWGELPEDIEE